jgi:glycerophosphoryl diester phosphodiesterase
MRFLLYLLLFTTLQAAPKLIAHRGASQAAPENTLAAFRLAWKEGADGIEGDFRLSKDGKIVCIHDADTKRANGAKFVVADTDSHVLRKLDVGKWKAWLVRTGLRGGELEVEMNEGSARSGFVAWDGFPVARAGGRQQVGSINTARFRL